MLEYQLDWIKNKDLLFKIAEKEKISLLGVSAKFIDQLKKLKLNIKSKFKLVEEKIFTHTFPLIRHARRIQCSHRC